MKYLNQWTAGVSFGILSVIVFLSFQNCAQERGIAYVPSAATVVTTANPTTSPTPFVPAPLPSVVASATPLPGSYVLKPNSNIVFKFPKPAGMTSSSDYYWIVSNHQNRLVAFYGNIVLDSTGQYILVNITTRSNNTSTTSMRINFYNKSTSTYLNDNYNITIDASAVESVDNVGELCARADITQMTFWVTRNALTVINFFDHGSGIAYSLCKFGASQTAADCLDGTKWSADWRSYPIEITLWNRCDRTATQTFQP